MSSSNSTTTEYDAKVLHVWRDDKLKRIDNAKVLYNYILSGYLNRSGASTHDHSGLTVAVDAPYGVGKSFFLKRFVDHLKLSGCAEYVDTWSDDIYDDPFSALIATIESAINPHLDSTNQNKWNNFKSIASKFSRSMGKSIARQAATVILTEVGAKALEGVVKDVSKDMLSDRAAGVVDGISLDVNEGSLSQRIEDFKKSKKFLTEMKISLREAIDSLAKKTGQPVVIVVDELDRCRPTYAIKLFEEVKQLFDIDGLTFVFGINIDQLSQSVKVVYGNNFDSRSYLRRFINRVYSLDAGNPKPVVHQLMKNYSNIDNIDVPFMVTDRSSTKDVVDIISKYIESYEVPLRYAHRIVATIMDVVDMSNGKKVFLPYLVPFVIDSVYKKQDLSGSDMPNVPEFVFSGSPKEKITHQNLFKLVKQMSDSDNSTFLRNYSEHPMYDYHSIHFRKDGVVNLKKYKDVVNSLVDISTL